MKKVFCHAYSSFARTKYIFLGVFICLFSQEALSGQRTSPCKFKNQPVLLTGGRNCAQFPTHSSPVSFPGLANPITHHMQRCQLQWTEVVFGRLDKSGDSNTTKTIIWATRNSKFNLIFLTFLSEYITHVFEMTPTGSIYTAITIIASNIVVLCVHFIL